MLDSHTPETHAGELVDAAPFFAPVPFGPIGALLDSYAHRRHQIDQVAALFEGDIGGVVGYFIEGNRHGDGSRYSSLSAEKIFEAAGAIAALNADYWRRTLDLTDIFSCMPQVRRDTWIEQFAKHNTPEFTEENVHATLEELERARLTFLAEKVDGIFRGLSRHHVTNQPHGFSARMILEYVFSSYGTPDSTRGGLIHDLRCVIAKFMGREEPKLHTGYSMLDACRTEFGRWWALDGGALRIRVYKKGTAHLEVHPDMAWRLNAILAHLHPTAIPSELRRPPEKRPREFATLQRPLPFVVLQAIDKARPTGRGPHNSVTLYSYDTPREVLKEACQVLEALGGALESRGGASCYRFDYDPTLVLRELVLSGCLPDQKAYQFYPTPATLAEQLIELANIGPADTCLEPSAGTGAIAALLPKDRTTCVELSALHCAVLQAHGLVATCADFLAWSESAPQFDRVVMNPPFSEGRAHLHLNAAARLVRPGGRLVAILPAIAHGRPTLRGWACTWSPILADAFDGTSVAVTILTADRPPA